MAVEDDLMTPKRLEVVDPHNAPIQFVDWIVTGGMFQNVLNVTLGTIDHSMKESNEESARVVVATHLRMPREFATIVHTTLGNILGLNPDQTGTPTPSVPPQNTIN